MCWMKMALLTISGIVVPLFMPHPFVPVNPGVCSEFNTLNTRDHTLTSSQERHRAYSRTDLFLGIISYLFIPGFNDLEGLAHVSLAFR